MSAQSIQSQINQGQGRRKSAEAAAKKSIRLQNAGTKKPKGRRSAAMSSARKSAGQKSLTRKGIGCVIKILKQRSAKSLGKALRYASEGDTNQLIFSNCGHDNASLEAIMSAVVSQRSAVKTPIGHIMISPSNTSGLDESRLTELSEFALDELGIDRSLYAATVYLHKDETSTNHLHVTYARVGYDGSLHSSDNIAFLAMTACEKIENRFNLKLTLREEKNKGRTPPTQGQLAEFRRTSVPSKMMQLQDGIDQAMDGAKDINEFQKRLALIGIDAQFNVQQKNGKPHCAGLVYAFSDGSFKASATALGSRYGLWNLKKRNLVYDPNQSASTTNSSTNAPSSQPINIGQNNGVAETEKPRPVSNDVIRNDAPDQEPSRDGIRNSSIAPIESVIIASAESRPREPRRADKKLLDNNSLINVSDVPSDAGSADMEVKLTRKERRAIKHKAEMLAQANLYLAEEAILKEINAAKTEAKEEAILQAAAEPIDRQKRVEAIKPFKDTSFKNSNLSENRYKHEMAIKLDSIESPTIIEIEEAENETIIVLIEGDFSPPKIQEMLNKNSILHKQIPHETALPENADANLIKYVERIEKQRVEIILQSKLAVEKATKQLEALRKLEKPAPKTASEWTPFQPK